MKRILIGSLFVLCLIVTSETDRPFALAGEKPQDALTALKREKVELLESLVKQVSDAHTIGNTSYTEVVEIQKQLLLARLELETQKEKRLSLLESIVENRKVLLETQEKRFLQGTVTSRKVMEARVELLDARIALEKERRRPSQNVEQSR